MTTFAHIERITSTTWRVSTCCTLAELPGYLRKLTAEPEPTEIVVPGTFPFKTVKAVEEMP
jgi:hypothetical protein